MSRGLATEVLGPAREGVVRLVIGSLSKLASRSCSALARDVLLAASLALNLATAEPLARVLSSSLSTSMTSADGRAVDAAGAGAEVPAADATAAAATAATEGRAFLAGLGVGSAGSEDGGLDALNSVVVGFV